MRGLRYGLAVLAVVLSAVSSVDAIDQGPGGRIYMSSVNFTSGVYPRPYDNSAHLMSLQIDQGWDILGAEQDHGSFLDRFKGVGWYGSHMTGGLSPEVETHAGDGYGTLVAGAYYNNNPTSYYGGTTQTMDVLRLTPSDGALTVETLGTGRAYNGSNLSNTDRGIWAVPDPKGLFTGGPYCYSVAVESGSDRISVVTDTNGDGDLTDNDADYVAGLNATLNEPQDQEILGNRHYYLRGDGIRYFRREADCSISGPYTFVTDCGTIMMAPGRSLDL